MRRFGILRRASQFSSVQSLSRVWLCDSMNCSLPGLSIHHQLAEFTQTYVHWVGDAIQPSHPLLSPSPRTFNLSQYLFPLKRRLPMIILPHLSRITFLFFILSKILGRWSFSLSQIELINGKIILPPNQQCILNTTLLCLFLWLNMSFWGILFKTKTNI